MEVIRLQDRAVLAPIIHTQLSLMARSSYTSRQLRLPFQREPVTVCLPSGQRLRLLQQRQQQPLPPTAPLNPSRGLATITTITATTILIIRPTLWH